MARRTTVTLRSRLLLRETRKLRDLSLRDMGDRLPCGKSFIQALEVGTKTTCSAAVGARIEEVLGVPEGLLFQPVKSAAADSPSLVRDGQAA